MIKKHIPSYINRLTIESKQNGDPTVSAEERVERITERLDEKLLRTSAGKTLKKFLKGDPYPSELKPIYLLIITGGLILIAFNLSKILSLDFSLILLLIFLGEAGVLFYSFRKRKKVKDLLEERLPEILETMARVYRIHPDLRAAIQEVNTYIIHPQVRTKFEDILKLSRFGYTTQQAMEIVAKDLGSTDLEFAVTSIKLSAPLGGNLANLFEKTADILRKRKETSYEIGNVMFQNRISSTISAALVPFIVILAFTSSRNYQKVLLEDPTGRLILIISLFWWLIGVYLVVRSSRVKI